MNAATPDDERARRFEEMLSSLTDREREVLIMRFGLIDGQSHTLQEAADRFGVTRERIRQVESRALRKLRHPRRDDGMAGALVRK